MGNKITIIGSGSVGSTIAYTLAVQGTASEIVMIDINVDKSLGEALDIRQGTPFCAPCSIYAGGYEDAKDSDVVILLLPAGRGSHVELGMALAWNKKIYLCTSNGEDFSIENTVVFYELPQVVRLTGTADENLKRIMEG